MAGNWQILVRDSTLRPVGEVDAYEKVAIAQRYNRPGTWQIQMKADHPMAELLLDTSHGVIITRTPPGGTQQTIITGPTKFLHREYASDTIVVSGYDDLSWLGGRLVYPVSNYPYQSTILADNPIRLHPMNDTNSTAIDASGHYNGAYGGTPTYLQPSVIDDINQAITFGLSNWLAENTTGLPIGNAPFSIEVWMSIPQFPAQSGYAIFVGVPNDVRSMGIIVKPQGLLTLMFKNQPNTSTIIASVTPNVSHHLALTYDGNTNGIATAYIDNISAITATQSGGGGVNIQYGTVSFGAQYTGGGTISSPLPGTYQFAAYYNTCLSPAQVANHYFIGKSRFAASQYEKQWGTSEGVIKWFVYNEAAGGAEPVRQVPNLKVVPDAGRGIPYLEYDARFEQLVDKNGTGLLQLLAQAGGLRLYVYQQGTDLWFDVATIQDRSASCIFSADLSNLADYMYEVNGQDISNFLIAGGSGTGTGRLFAIGEDPNSIVAWGRQEGFVSAGSSSDYNAMYTSIQSQLATQANNTTFAATVIDTRRSNMAAITISAIW